MEPANKIVIVGAGLSGLTLAYYLSKQGVATTILEASSRIGGRIQTIEGALGTPLDMGATWFSEQHVNLLQLTEELGLSRYPQYSEGITLFQTKSFEPAQEFFVPAATQPSYRLAGGTQALVQLLAKKLGTEQIHLDQRVNFIENTGSILNIGTVEGSVYQAEKVVICVPPQLAASAIRFLPALPLSLTELMPTVQTWMAGSVKFALEYREPFWRKGGYSGMIYSNAGIVGEMYDHTNAAGNKFALTGFLGGGAAAYSPAVRKELVLAQLKGLLGLEAGDTVGYYDKVWNDENLLAGQQAIFRPHQNNGHALLREGYMNDKVFFSATETASLHPGYMEGAVVAAKAVLENLVARQVTDISR